jgi:hypothetical protein
VANFRSANNWYFSKSDQLVGGPVSLLFPESPAQDGSLVPNHYGVAAGWPHTERWIRRC